MFQGEGGAEARVDSWRQPPVHRLAAEHELEEYLELLYHLHEQHELDLATLRDHNPAFEQRVLERLVEEQAIVLTPGQRIELTADGLSRAGQIVRRHRLAERLLADVLHMSPDEVERAACEYEHMLAEEITDSICILLGHPRSCPHGSPIPRGPCCRAAATQCQSAMVSLAEAPVGEWVRVAYVSSEGDHRQHQLTHFGIHPGRMVKVHQTKPAFVVLLERSRLAMEESVARDIYVWKGWRLEPGQQRGPWRARR